jgi:CrcB protein
LKFSSKIVALTFVGGSAGTLARYFLGSIHQIPFANFWAVNILGAIAIGVFSEIKWFATPDRKALFVTGFAGGFTTMSGLSLMMFYSWQQVFVQLAVGVAVYLATRYLCGRLARG